MKYIPLPLFSLILFACEKPDNSNIVEPYYSTSFETENDTTGWHGMYADLSFGNDIPPGGGTRSVEVSGGFVPWCNAG